MAPKKYKGTNYVYASELSDMSVREISAEMEKVFRDANDRLDKLYKSKQLEAKGVAVDDDIRSVTNLIKELANARVPLSGRSDTRIFRVGADREKMSMPDQLKAYQIAVDFLRDKTSTVQGAVDSLKTAKENLVKAFKSGRDYAVKQLGKNNVEPRGYFESLANRELDDEEITYTVGGKQHIIRIKKGDSVYTALGHILNSVRSSLSAMSINASDGITAANSNNQYYTRFVDVLSKYLFAKEQYDLDEMVQKAVDEFVSIQSGTKSSGGTSSAPGRIYSSLVNRGRRRR